MYACINVHTDTQISGSSVSVTENDTIVIVSELVIITDDNGDGKYLCLKLLYVHAQIALHI